MYDIRDDQNELTGKFRLQHQTGQDNHQESWYPQRRKCKHENEQRLGQVDLLYRQLRGGVHVVMADESGHAKVAHRYGYQAPNHEKSHDEERVADLCVCGGKFHDTRSHDRVESKCGRT